MSKVCDICNKGRTTGHNISHSKRHTKRTWHPNLITKRMEVDGRMQKIKMCARCLKTLSKPPRKKPVRNTTSAVGGPAKKVSPAVGKPRLDKPSGQAEATITEEKK